MSPDGKCLAMREKFLNEKGRVTIYEILGTTKKQELPSAPDQSKQFQSNEMVCSAFNERKPDQIVTLCGEPDWTIIFWDIEK